MIIKIYALGVFSGNTIDPSEKTADWHICLKIFISRLENTTMCKRSWFIKRQWHNLNWQCSLEVDIIIQIQTDGVISHMLRNRFRAYMTFKLYSLSKMLLTIKQHFKLNHYLPKWGKNWFGGSKDVLATAASGPAKYSTWAKMQFTYDFKISQGREIGKEKMSKNIPWMGLEKRLRYIYIKVLHLIFSFILFGIYFLIAF